MEENDLKAWPKDGSAVGFNNLSDPLCELLKEAIRKGDEVYKGGLIYKGFDLGETLKMSNHSPKEIFLPENLLSNKINKSITVFDEIIFLAIQMGIEQGRRRKLRDIKNATTLLKNGFTVIESMKKVIDKLSKTDEELLKEMSERENEKD